MANVKITFYNGKEATFDDSTVRPTNQSYLVLNKNNGKVRVRIARTLVYDIDRDATARGYVSAPQRPTA